MDSRLAEVRHGNSTQIRQKRANPSDMELAAAVMWPRRRTRPAGQVDGHVRTWAPLLAGARLGARLSDRRTGPFMGFVEICTAGTRSSG